MAVQTFQLVMRSGPNPGKVFELKQAEMTIGRDVSNHIVINDPEISRKHTRLTAQPGGYLIEDLGSTNGTFVNGQRLAGPYMLRHGDGVMLGENISLAFEAMSYDPDATMISAGAQAAVPPSRDTYVVPPPADTYPEPAMPQPVYGGEYSGHVPPGPPEPFEPAAAYEAPVMDYEQPVVAKKSNRTLIYIIIGVIVVICCCLVVAGIAFDSLDLYCEPPFNSIFSCP